MKRFLISVGLYLVLTTTSAGEVVEVEVLGMTCAFCTANLQRSLEELPETSLVEVSYKHKKVRVVVDTEKVDVARIKQAIVDSGFTPGQVLSNVPIE